MDRSILKSTDIKLPIETELMKQVLDNAQVAIVITDNDHKLKYVNREFTRIFGYPYEAAIGKYTYDLIVPEDHRIELEQLTERLERLERSEYETIRCSKDGRRINVLCRLSPIIQNHKRMGVFEFYSDISEQKRSQEEMEKAHDELEIRVKSRTRELREANKKLKSEIHERKGIEEALRESEEGYRTAIERSNDGVIIVQGRRYVYVNQRYADIYGYESPDEIMGKLMNQFIHPNDLESVSEMAKRRQKGELQGQQYEHKGIRKNGTPIHVEVSVAKTVYKGKPASLVYTRDISDRKRIEEALRESEEIYRSLVDNIDLSINLIDSDFNIVMTNTVSAKRREKDLSELIGRKCYKEIENKDTVCTHCPGVQAMASGKRQVLEKSHTYHDDTKAYLKIYAFPVIGQNGKAKGFIEVAENITEAKKAEEALKETNQRLEMAIAEANQMARQAQAANQAKSEFLANISHEIRTPMNGIIGMTELALGTNLTREQREYLEMVKISANSLLAVLNDVLDLSKIEAGKIELEEIDFDLRTTIERVTEIVAVKAGEAMLELTCRIRPEVSTALVGDPGRLRQVLVNLVGNAVKFTEEGEIGIEVKTETEEDSSVLLHFMVSDTGIGISPDMLENIFESFRQADGSITRKYEGTGLGLSISKQLVELMGGSIWVESELGKGSTFHFTARFGLSRKEVAEALSFKDLDLSGLRVLIVDDNATNRLVFHEMTAMLGLKPIEVADGEQALAELERAHSSGQPYQLVLLDLQMPDFGGFEVAERIRENPICSGLEIIILTSLGMKGDVERCKEIGIGGYLVKPVKQSELFDGIMLAMGHPGEKKRPVITRHTIEDVKKRLKILLAEDNIVNQKLALKMLEKHGHHVSVSSDGLEAIEALKKERFDLILMDVQMPEMDGLEATRRIRDREKHEGGHIPIVAMTAHAMKGDRERCLAAGMDDYVPKPIQASELFEVIERLDAEFQFRNEKTHRNSLSENGELRR